MPKNLHKVQKKLSKKRGKLDSMHEKSRDAKLLRRAGAREDRLARVATSAAIARQSFWDRIAFFQECLKEAAEPLTLSDAEMANFVHTYIHRSQPEIEQLREERRKGRPPTKREEVLEQRQMTEEKESRSGFWMPDLTEEGVRRQLLSWNGEWSSLSSMQFIRFSEGGSKQPSTFPPKGLS